MIGETIAKNLIERYNPKSVLFCPYKEEMWDSMQTIYEYFDDKCKDEIAVSIMPIAYYSLSNGRINDLNIEFGDYAHAFPKALKRRWDIIIFHYPYDNLNNVTRPLLFSNELKAFCKHLVSVGYACVGDRLPYEQELHYAGIRNSDLVISETEEQAKRANELTCSDKFVGWGSAKYDMIEKAEIPKEWIDRADGRRVVLLQSSIVPFLQDRNKLNKLESIIRNYTKNPKTCLIWRHHPLYRDTIIAHHRQELAHFETLVRMVKESPKDIYDDTKTPETAIKFADEMISDASSLVILWKTTGKKLTMI